MASAYLSRLTSSILARSGPPTVHRQFSPSPLVSWVSKVHTQRKPHAQPLRVLSTAAPPYWDDDRQRVNVFTGFTVYKTKAAMSLAIIKPTWEKVSSGVKIKRAGVVLLEFANSVGTQKYDWERKETFALNAVECSKVLNISQSREETTLLHDPKAGTADARQVYKQLRISPAEKGWFFSLSSTASGSKVDISCPVSDEELRLLTTLFTYLIPRLLGFDEHFAGAPTVVSGDATSDSGPAASAPPF